MLICLGVKELVNINGVRWVCCCEGFPALGGIELAAKGVIALSKLAYSWNPAGN